MKRITIKDLAKHLLLSTSTVSRALVNDKHIHPETKEKVLTAAKKLGYKPNTTALNLRYGQSKSIGFVVPEMTTPFSAGVLEGIQSVLDPLGYRVIILQSDENPDIERKNLNVLEEFNVDGIIINTSHETQNTAFYQAIMQRGTPMVFFDRIPDPILDVSKVLVNDQIKASLMVEHLLDQGCRRIAHIMGPTAIRNSKERAQGYQQIMQKHQLYDPALMSKTKGMSFEDGKKAVQQLLDKDIPFDGIFAFSDTLAIGALNYLHELAIAIPQQVAIASFSGTTLARIVHPQLSSVEPPLFQMGANSASLVLEKIKNPEVASKTIVLNAELHYRVSTLG